MKKLLVVLSLIFLCTFAIAQTISIDWKVGNNTYAQNTCEYGGTLTVPATPPTKYGYTFQGWGDYIKLEYIESTGTQYIDTGFNLSDASSFGYEMKVFLKKSNANDAEQRFFSNERITDYITDIYYNQETKNFIIRYIGNSLTVRNIDLFERELFFEHKNARTKIVNETDNVVLVDTDQVFQTHPVNQNFFIGTKANSPSPSYGFVGKIYYLKFWASGILVRNFIPAKNIDGSVGMYDTVSRSFFTNAGTGEFIAGPNVQ